MGRFITPYDIANRAAQIIGVPRITNFLDQSKQATEFGFNYEKLRRSEFTKNVWNCAVRRAVLRKIVVGTTKPLVFGAYSAATTYGFGDIIRDSSYTLWISNQASNLANSPGIGGINPPWSVFYGNVVAQLHDVAVTYYPGDVVYASSTAYICILTNLNQAPPNTTYWMPLTATLGTAISFFAPFVYNKDATATVRNIYRRPNGFLRIAPLDAKQPGNVRSNTTAGMAWNDIEFEGEYFLSAFFGATTGHPDPLVIRFVADQADVPSMDDTFCEALAARMAVETAETLTQSMDKKKMAMALYDNAIAVARMVNAIEAGTTEPEANAPIAQPQGRENG